MTSKDLNAAMTATTSEHNTSTSSDDSSSDDDSLRSMFPEYYSKQDLNTPFDDVDDDTLNNTASYGSTLLPKSQSMNEQNNIDVSQTSQYEMVSSISNNSTTEQNDQDPGHTIRTLHFQITKRNAKSRNVAIVSLNQLKQHFQQFGNIHKLRLRKSVGTVTFTTATSASKASEIKTHLIAGYTVAVRTEDCWKKEKIIVEESTKQKFKNNTESLYTTANEVEPTMVTGGSVSEEFVLEAVEENCNKMPTNDNEDFDYGSFSIDSESNIAETLQILQHHGHSIKELSIHRLRSRQNAQNVFDSVIKYCNCTLESLKLNECAISKVEYNFKNFFARHTNLKKIVINNSNDYMHLLPTMAECCSALQELEIKITGYLVEAKKSIKSLQTLHNLRKLTIHCEGKKMAKFVEILMSFNSLEFLHLYKAQGCDEFVMFLSKLTNLKVLQLTECTHIGDLNPLANLRELTELVVEMSKGFVKINICLFLECLKKLKKLDLNIKSFVIDKRTYDKIIETVERLPKPRPDVFVTAEEKMWINAKITK